MSIKLRINKDGSRAYEISIFKGRDPVTGKQKFHSERWPIPKGYSATRAENEARKYEGELKAKVKAGLLTKHEQKEKERKEALEYNKQPTFEEYEERFLKRMEANGQQSTAVTYKVMLEHARDWFGDLKLSEITRDMVKKYLEDFRTTRGYKHGYVSFMFKVLRSLFYSAVDDEILVISPMYGVKCPKKPKNEVFEDGEKEQAYTEEEVKMILKCIKNEPLKWQANMIFALDTGCRRGEILGLKWENVDLKTGEVKIWNNLIYTKEKGIHETTPKNERKRTITLTKYALEVMKKWKREQQRLYFQKGVRGKGYCFETDKGEWISPEGMTHYYASFGKRYGIKDFHPHKFRHTMATISIANGADIVSIQTKLGHTNASTTTSFYAHANEQAQKRANDILGKAIYGN